MDNQVDIAATIEVYKQPKDHNQLKRMVEQYLDITRENADYCRRDRDYYDGDQISKSVKAELAKRGQPPLYNNKIRPAVSGIFGLIDNAETDPEAFPRNESGQDAADLVTKTLRYLADRTDYKKVRRLASENYVIEGTCGAWLEYDERGYIKLHRIEWEDFVFDPLARAHDFEDAKYLGEAMMLDEADVEARFPDTYTALGKPVGDFSDFFDDKSKSRWWSTAKRDRLRVVDLYYEVGGEWHRAVFCDSGMLYAGPSDYHDDTGTSMCPIVGASFEAKRNGDRYGIVRDMIPMQDSVNSRSSRLLHLTNHRQVQQTDMYAPAVNQEIARREAAKADGTIPFGWAVVPAPDLAQGQMLILQQDMQNLDRMAPTPAMLGRSGGASESGRARQILQQAGGTETARGFARFEEFEVSIYRKMWAIAREYLDQPTMIRILDDPKAPEFLKINEPIMGMKPSPAINPATGQPLIDPTTGRPHVVMQMGVIGMKNRIAELDMDIILSTVPDSVSLQHEVFQTLMDVSKSTGVGPWDPRFLGVLEMSPLPDKRAIIESIQQSNARQQQQPDPAQQAQAQAEEQASQIGMQAQLAKISKDKAHAEKATAEAERTTLENHVLVAQVGAHVAQTYPQV